MTDLAYTEADARADDFTDAVWRHLIGLMASPDWNADLELTENQLFDLAADDLTEERGWQHTMQSLRGRL